ncbi:ABC transporter permease [Acidobacteriota bacterium]
MLNNYLKIALRNFKRHKGYSFINLAGFAIGMACCLLIFIYIRQETSYDKFHNDGDRVYRIVQDIRSQTANRIFAPISPMVAPTLIADFPQVEQAARIITAGSRLVKKGDVFFYEDRFMWADQEIFDVLTIPFVRGNPQEALTRPQTVVISEIMAGKYFGHAEPIGQLLSINQTDYEVTGVLANSPENTHIKYDLIASLVSLSDWNEMGNWYSTMFYTYLKLRPNVDVEDFSQKASHLADKYVGQNLASRGTEYVYSLQPLSGIHLNSHIRYETEPPGNPQNIYIFLFVGLFILIIACLNFMNLSTARSASRGKEVGLRKVVGAQRRQLISQFMGESLLLAILSMVLALLIAWLVIPLLNRLTGTMLNFSELFSPVIILVLIVGAILVGIASGFYPALVLSSFRPAQTLKGLMKSGSRNYSLRNVLVVVQFAISVFLIIGTLFMFKQFNFMKDQHLGFDKEQKLVLPLRGGIDIQENFREIKDVFSKHSTIKGITVSSSVPGRGVSNFGVRLVGEEDTKNQDMFHSYFDPDFIPMYEIEMLSGRPFQEEMSTDFMGAFLINEAAVKAFGWTSPEDALGKRIQTGHGGRINPIIGVTQDFHYRGLQSDVEPLVMEYLPWTFRYLTLSIDISGLKETMSFVQSQWKTVFPNNPFESFFLDTEFDLQYREEEQVGQIFSVFTVLGLFIACLGLLGLASFTTERRTKEIGIRKVLGASVPEIVVMLSKQFTKWVLVSNCIAWPLAYYFLHQWLKSFAYSTKIDIFTFLLSGFLVLFLALLTVSFQTVRAATANPSDSLRYE